MEIVKLLQQELEQESQITRKMLERVPADKFEWRPHPKSMTLQELATHLAEIPGWFPLTLTTTELDFATMPYQPTVLNDSEALLAFFKQKLDGALAALENASEKDLSDNWTMRNGETIFEQNTKYEALRGCFGQIIHHRAQLGVYLRLLDIPLPGTYGPSADENQWNFGE